MPDTLAALSPSPTARDLAHDVEWVPLSVVNVYLVGPRGAGNGEWVLVDAGLSFSAGTIRAAAAERFGPDSRPKAIVLTHAHFDHVGALRALAELWDVPVYAHRLEMPYLTGRASYPPPDPTVGGGMMSYLCHAYSRRPVSLPDRARPLPADGTVPGMPGWEWVSTPGHSPGHVAFFRPADGFLIAGDAVVTTKQESMTSALSRLPQEVRRSPAYFTCDWGAARASVRALARLKPRVLATGHGTPMRGEAMLRELDDLAAHFDRHVPSVGRYVRAPAVADETGPTFVPPPLIEPVLGVLAAVGVGLAVGLRAGRR